MREASTLPTTAFDALLRGEELEERLEFTEWGNIGDILFPDGCF